MDYLSTQFSKDRIAKIARELQRQAKAKLDLVYPLSKLSVGDDGALVFAGHDRGFRVGDRTFVDWESAEGYLDHSRAEELEGADDWKVELVEELPVVELSKKATSQLLQRLGIPGRFATELLKRGFSDVLGSLKRDLLGKYGAEGKKVLVRTLDGKVRAILGESYRILDSSDLFFAAAERFKQEGGEIWDARLWDDGFELFAVREGISEEVSLDRTFDPGDGWRSRWYGKEGDVHNPAVRVSNSETGGGGLKVSIAVLRRVCANFCVWGDVMAQIHSGAKISVAEDLIVSDETRQKEGELVWSKVKDSISTAFDEERFRTLIQGLNEATKDAIEDPRVAVSNVLGRYELSQDRQEAILDDLLASGDRSRFGLVQSVTAQAHKLFDADPELASTYESIGGELASMSSKDFLSAIG